MIQETVFDPTTTQNFIDRINSIEANKKPAWGKMDAAQMLAHCNVVYEMSFEDIHKKPNGFVKFMLKAFAKSTVVGGKPYKKSGQTAPQMIVSTSKEFETEKQRLITYLNKTQQLGAAHFEQRESFSFGKLSSAQWNTMFYKHLQHHLAQFNA